MTLSPAADEPVSGRTSPDDSGAAAAMPLLAVENLQTWFYTARGVAKAVNGVSFDLNAGETLGLLGESGSGKSITALSLMRLVPGPAGQIAGGSIRLNGQDILQLPESEMRHIRGKSISMILQDPLTSLNPVFRVGEQVAEPLEIHNLFIGKVKERVLQLLEQVRIPDARSRVENYPHQFSGGMRQRVVGAIAMASEPRVLIADEPTTSLDVTTQAQFLRLLDDMKASSNLAVLLITHDLGVVARTCDRVAVMYCGRIVEHAPVRVLFDEPAHPYTRGLIASLPRPKDRGTRLKSIPGQHPSLYALPTGCPFAPRCPDAMDICRKQPPPDVTLGENHAASCWLHAPADMVESTRETETAND